MELLNPTSLPSMAFRQFDAAGQLDCVVALRGTFRHSQDAAAEWMTEQEPFQWEDVYEGDPHLTPLLRQTDLTPGKVGTDVTFLGASHAPLKGDGRWTCGLQIGPVSKQLHVSGPRHWVPQALPARPWRKGGITGWTLGQPQAVDKVPLDWRLAHGGPPVFRPDAPADNRNPIGCGWLGPADDWKDAPQPAPQILMEPNPDPLHSPMPAGFGPVSPFWQDRARHAGTYDDDWVQNRHPLLPQDFDPRFWQCAPPDQIAIPFLRGMRHIGCRTSGPVCRWQRGACPALPWRLKSTAPAGGRLTLTGCSSTGATSHSSC